MSVIVDPWRRARDRRRAAWPAGLLAASIVVAGGTAAGGGTSQVLIQRADLDGSNVETVLQAGAGSPGGIDLDLGAGKLYWTVDDCPGNSKIRRAESDGSQVEDLVTGLDRVLDIALDVRNEKMYWVGGTGCTFGPDYIPRIRRADLDGSDPQEVVVGGDVAQGIAIDPDQGKIYWTTQSDCIPCGGAWRSKLDGSEIEFLTGPLAVPRKIDLDLAAGRMYWTDWSDDFISGATGAVRRANLDGTEHIELIAGLDWLVGIAVGSPHVYWTSDLGDKIQRANLDGSNVQDLVVADGPTGIALDPVRGRMYWVAVGPPAAVPAVHGGLAVVLVLLLLAVATVVLLWR